MQSMEEIIEQEMGENGIRQIVAGFYRRVKNDDLLGPMYPPNDWEGAEERLSGFLRFRMLGDMSYIEQRGHPRLRMRHIPFKIGPAEAERWVNLMEESMEECQVSAKARQALLPFFVQVADAMMNA